MFSFFSNCVKIERKKDIYDSFFLNSGNSCAYDKVSPFPVWSSTDAGGVAWHKSQKAQQSKGNFLKILIPKAAEKIPGKNFLIYNSRIVGQEYSQASTFLGVLNVSLRAYLRTFHKQNLDIYSEGNSFIRK